MLWQWLEGQRASGDLQEQMARKLAEMNGVSKSDRSLLTQSQDQVHELSSRIGALEARLAEIQNQHAALDTLYADISAGRGEVVLADIEQMLLTAAQQHPEVNFFAIEIVRKYQLFTATRMAVRKLSNVRVACADARLFVPRVPPASVQAVHVYYPDPWWKKRHKKPITMACATWSWT